MNRILVLGAKELLVTVRNKMALFWIFIFPTLFAVFFGVVMSGNAGKQSPLLIAFVDEAHTTGSAALKKSLSESDAVRLIESDEKGILTADRAKDRVRQGQAVAFLVVPNGYGESINPFWMGGKPVELGVDPSRKAEAGMLEGVLMQAIFSDMGSAFSDPKKSLEFARQSIDSIDAADGLPAEQRELLKSFLQSLVQFAEGADFTTRNASPFSTDDRVKKVDVLPDQSGKPRSAFEMTFPSSVTWGMYGCILTFAISIVSERTIGTLVRLRMSPLTNLELVAGKGIACFTASVSVAVLLILLARIAFGIRIDNLFYLALAIGSAAFSYTGIMMALASFGKTEKDVAGAAAGIFMPLSMIGGAMIPRMFMPAWMQSLSVISPIRWNIESIEGAIWRGYSLAEMALPCGVLCLVGIVGFAIGTVSLSRMVD